MARGSDMPVELREKIPNDVRYYVRNFWQHPNRPEDPYDFYDDSGEKFLHYLAAESGPLVPGNWGDIVVLLFARGCLKTTTCTMISTWAIDVFNNIEGLVTAPRREQSKEVMDRFKYSAEQAGLTERRTENSKTYQQFSQTYVDNKGNKRTGYSTLKSRSAWGEGDGLRGIHAQFGIVDEFQDVDESMFSVFLEAIDQSLPAVPYFPTIFVIGTPKMANSFFHTLWNMSDKREWDDDKKEWVQSQDPDEYLSQEAKEERARLRREADELRDIDPVEHKETIEELERQADAIHGFTVTGWHIDQYACPLHDPARIAYKKATYSKRKFRNEVEALFYSPENDLLTEEHVREAFINDGWHKRPITPGADTFIGVDWGGGSGEGAASTVVTIGEELPDGRIQILMVDFFDSNLTANEEVQRVEDYIISYEPVAVVADEGYGAKSRQNLQEGIGTKNSKGYDMVYGCQYGNVNLKDGVTWSRKGGKDFFTVNRTFMIESFVEDFKRGNVLIPADDLEFAGRDSNGTRLLRELSAPYTDRVETIDGRKKLRVQSDINDDAFHAFTYMWIAANHVRSKRQVFSVASNKMQGYDEDEEYY